MIILTFAIYFKEIVSKNMLTKLLIQMVEIKITYLTMNFFVTNMTVVQFVVFEYATVLQQTLREPSSEEVSTLVAWRLVKLIFLLSLYWVSGSTMALSCTQKARMLWISGCPTTGGPLTLYPSILLPHRWRLLMLLLESITHLENHQSCMSIHY